MAPSDDPFWRAAAAHVAGLGLPPRAVFAPVGFQALMPGCRTMASAPASSATPDYPAALVVHKGRLNEAPVALLLAAMDGYALTFANEVLMVFSLGGVPVGADNPHVMRREALLVAALEAHERKSGDSPRHAAARRMPATYMGQGRVLLETAFGQLMLVDGRDTAIVPHLIRDGWFDRNLTDVIGGLLAPGMTFIDIGANCGTYTIYAAGKVGRAGRVIAIEAAPAIAALLHESVVMNGFGDHAEVLRCAAGAEAGTLLLHQFATRQGGNTMLPHIAASAQALYGETITTTEVECRPVDAIIAERDLARIDLIKIDVEGFEREVLLGARTTLRRYRPRLIVEWHNSFFTGRPEAAQALYALLTGELGYRLHRIEPDATTRPVTLSDLGQGHADLLAEPPPL
jgi:FkbM family methyltransferase